jgi:hypothetical protein
MVDEDKNRDLDDDLDDDENDDLIDDIYHMSWITDVELSEWDLDNVFWRLFNN